MLFFVEIAMTVGMYVETFQLEKETNEYTFITEVGVKTSKLNMFDE